MLVVYIYFLGLFSLILGVSTEEKKPWNWNFRQSDYKLKFEWGEVIRYNKNYLREYHGIVFKYNRTCTVGNLTFLYKVDVGNDLEILAQAYKFLSNEYRLFPIRLQLNMCEGFIHNILGTRRCLGCGNFTGCPIMKGKRYHVCNFAPDPSLLPPFIPSGRYQLELQTLYHDEEMALINVYGEVYRPIMGK